MRGVKLVSVFASISAPLSRANKVAWAHGDDEKHDSSSGHLVHHVASFLVAITGVSFLTQSFHLCVDGFDEAPSMKAAGALLTCHRWH